MATLDADDLNAIDALIQAAIPDIADAVLRESVNDHKSFAHSLAKNVYQIRQANMTIDGVVTSAISPTATQFSTDITTYGNSAFRHGVLLFVNGSSVAEQASPIVSYTASNGVFVLEDELTQAPQVGDEFVVLPSYYVHTVAEIQNGLGIMVTPVVAQTPVRVVGSNIETFIGDLSDIRVGIFSGTDPVDLSGFGDLEVCVQERDGTDLDLVPMADLTIDGDSNEYVTWTPNGPSVSQVRRGKWSLRKTSNKQVIGYGSWIVVDAALGDGS